MKINRNEMLRYLGHKGQEIDEGLSRMIQSAIDEIEGLKYKVIFEAFDIKKQDDGHILLDASLTLRGQSIGQHLKDSDRVILMAVTLGNKIEDLIRQLNYRDSAKAMIYDAAASAMVEAVCDYVEDSIRVLYEKEGYYITSRFSPGYGDLSLEVQRDFLKVLQAEKKIGLHVTETNILLPRKSVTAIIGLQKQPFHKIEKKCETCNLKESCEFAMKGDYHGTC